MRYLNALKEALEEYPSWIANRFVEMAKQRAAFLSVGAPDPDLLKPVDPERIAIFNNIPAVYRRRRNNEQGRACKKRSKHKPCPC